ncbi:pyridoxal phosphate-dependent aminotransferase [Alicyclobacillus fastidiosus]|uniref:cysteine-S-conjugate beta-lyase n=1 Tax=Alicyclobacillus fastidiosus TaxID=392011 RepID=A0ABY6ZMW4_9BACL|nr:MalY/PatB family protein [Alicyclobacillus fastidiosus]WAH44224.1 pyridoxal phosphate-dependent aminotransferase [Alicyclobacillus fastidiosus]
MAYDFDSVILRRQTGASKWDTLAERFGKDDVIPMWVADMDFASPSCVQEALVERAKHGVYGYAVRTDEYFDSIIHWMKERHGWTVEREWIASATGVVPALTVIVQAFTQEGDGVLIQPPVYYPFKRVIRAWGRNVVENPLVYRNGHYEIDFDDLEEKAKEARVMFLCSPHNPVGRVWREDELRRIGEICLRHQVLVVADEIHADLVYSGFHHTPFASLSEQFAAASITCAAPSKTFNLAGLNTAYVVVPNAALKSRYELMLAKASMASVNVFGAHALAAAYREGGPWLDALMDYLEGNLRYLKDFVGRHIPELKVIEPQGTYLVWVDCRALGFERAALDHFFVHEAGLALDEGHLFGEEGVGFQRINIACPRSVLEQGLQQLNEAVERVVRRKA